MQNPALLQSESKPVRRNNKLFDQTLLNIIGFHLVPLAGLVQDRRRRRPAFNDVPWDSRQGASPDAFQPTGPDVSLEFQAKFKNILPSHCTSTNCGGLLSDSMTCMIEFVLICTGTLLSPSCS